MLSRGSIVVVVNNDKVSATPDKHTGGSVMHASGFRLHTPDLPQKRQIGTSLHKCSTFEMM